MDKCPTQDTTPILFTYPHISILLTGNLILSMMFSNFALIIELSLTYPHVPDKAQTNMHQILYMVSIRLILFITWNKKHLSKNVVTATSTLAEKFFKVANFERLRVIFSR